MLEYLSKFKQKRVLVIGDVMVDHYSYGVVERISPEAPVPIVRKTDTRFVLGGAGNVASNVASLGGSIALVGVVGNDFYRDHVNMLLRTQGVKPYLLIHEHKPTIVKHRIVADGGHQVMRVDIEDISPIGDGTAEQLFKQMDEALDSCDVIVFSDYAKGCVTKYLVERVVRRASDLKKYVIADPKPRNKDIFRGVDVVCPNEKEAREMTGLLEEDIEVIGERLKNELDATVVLTCDSRGVHVFLKDGNHHHIPALKVQAQGVAGAGDTFLASFALGVSSGMEIQDAALLGTVAGGLAAQKPSTSQVTFDELYTALKREGVSI